MGRDARRVEDDILVCGRLSAVNDARPNRCAGAVESSTLGIDPDIRAAQVAT